LMVELLAAALREECLSGRRTEYGQRYTVDFLAIRNEREARLRSAWIIRPIEEFPRLVSCYVL